jgi:CO/xanthine dehydrogenase FAD-binding subunit
MKPAPFEYVRPDTVNEACQLLAADDGARVIAGGQTLVPMLAMRLARPTRLVDIYRIAELNGIRAGRDAIVIGATTRQVQAERSPEIRASLPLLAKAMPWVGHPPTRNRGTVGGSIANADPAAEIPLVAVTLNAQIEIANLDGGMTLPADEFFIGPMLTVAAPGDCITAVCFPVWPHERVGAAFHEVSARKSDFAFGAAAAQVALDGAGRCVDVALGIGGVGDRPMRVDMSTLIGLAPDKPTITEAVHGAMRTLETVTDLHATAAYRSRIAIVLGIRALEDAAAQAANPGVRHGAAL